MSQVNKLKINTNDIRSGMTLKMRTVKTYLYAPHASIERQRFKLKLLLIIFFHNEQLFLLQKVFFIISMK
jgi:hypothetical protein